LSDKGDEELSLKLKAGQAAVDVEIVVRFKNTYALLLS
jgi:hypothetical protein